MVRIFMLVMQPCYGESGGGHGIEYRLYRQNEKYHLMDDVYFIFFDRVIKNGEPIGEVAKKKSSNIGEKTKKDVVIFKPNFLRALKVYLEYNRVCDYVKKLDKKYHFTNDDIYIFHDVKMAFAFAKLYDFSKTALIYHMQGSVYNEWKSFSGISSSIVQNTFNAIFKRACSKLRFLCFPSKGAKESLLESAPELEKFINQCNCKVVYNGVNCPDVSTEDLTIDVKSSEQEYSFITVAALNEAKAVERIPQYLEKLKQAGIHFKWILVGNGVMASIVQDEITKHSIKDNTVWFKEPVAHETILKMMSQCDFYILFHKQSVFDLSTLEAMHYGNIPILTPVGGNKEMIEEGSGFFVDDFTDASELLTAIHDGVRPLISSELLTKNIDAVRKYGNSITSSIVKETIVEIEDNGKVKSVPDRAHSRVAKAPQCFWLDDILDAHRRALSEGRTDFIDSCSMMKAYGYELYMTDGPYENIKITTPDDFYMMRAILQAKEDAQIYGLE